MAEQLATRTVRAVPKDVVGAVEIARLLGVTRQRVTQLAVSDPKFPKPWRTLATGRIWDLRLVLKWAEEAGRQVDQDVLEELRRAT